AAVRKLVADHPTAHSQNEEGRRLDTLEFKEAGAVGVAQIGALFAGISRSGITMVAGLVRGLDHEDAARFSFLLATPIIFAAGIYKVPDLAGHLGDGIRGQALVGSVFAGARGSGKALSDRTLGLVSATLYVPGNARARRHSSGKSHQKG